MIIKCDDTNEISEPEASEDVVKLEIAKSSEKLDYNFEKFETLNQFCTVKKYELDGSSDPALSLIEEDLMI